MRRSMHEVRSGPGRIDALSRLYFNHIIRTAWRRSKPAFTTANTAGVEVQLPLRPLCNLLSLGGISKCSPQLELPSPHPLRHRALLPYSIRVRLSSFPLT